MTFAPDQVFCIFDYETFSEEDLKARGAFNYSVHPSTDIICVAWRIGTVKELREKSTPTLIWSPHRDDETPAVLLGAMQDPDVILVAHNAFFEQVITRHVFARYFPRYGVDRLPPSRFLCTAALAAAMALPRKLETAAAVMRLTVQKDMEGNRLVKKWCKPRKPTKKDARTRHDDAGELERICEYARTDVDAEVELFLALPPLTAKERAVWIADQEIAWRGLGVDTGLVGTVLQLIDEEVSALERRALELTGDVRLSQVQRVKDWLAARGVFLATLDADAVAEALARRNLPDDARELLELRQRHSKTSTKKYLALQNRTGPDGRARDILMYHGAATGRWSGRGFQPQNLTKFDGKGEASLLRAIDMLKTGDLELVRLCYGDPMALFSGCVRSTVVPAEGCVLDVADYNAIEVRVLFWLAGHEEGLKAFRGGGKLPDGRKAPDIYEVQAADIFQIPATTIDADQRQVGKKAVLGCGYQMGAPRFRDQYGVSEEMAQAAVASYRRVNAPVVQLWKNLERAAIYAVKNPMTSVGTGRLFWTYRPRTRCLWCQLPSGRRLAYFEPEIQFEPPSWGGDPLPKLYYWYADEAKGGKWLRGATYGGQLTENVTQAVARDLLAEAILRVEAYGPWRVVLHVHDELIAERDVDAAAAFGDGFERFKALMEELPPWAAGLPVKAGGFTCTRYRK